MQQELIEFINSTSRRVAAMQIAVTNILVEKGIASAAEIESSLQEADAAVKKQVAEMDTAYRSAIMRAVIKSQPEHKEIELG